MNKQKLYLLLTLLILVILYTYNFIPRKFEVEGGSCYQGITTMIIRFFLIINAILNLTSFLLLFKSKIKTPKILSIIAIVIWIFVSFANTVAESSDNFIIAVLYFMPLIITNFFIIVSINKIKK